MAANTHLSHAAVALALLVSGSALAHGYISQPESRNYLCKTGGNSQCGGVQWEPQSVEGPSGFPQSGPQDGQIASAGSPRWSELNVQTSDRWTKRDVQAGPFAISWTFTANHVTRNWRYYLTKQDWNPNQPLTRASFDLNPFCVIEGNMVQPPKQVTHQCNLPERTGYQVILGVWEVGDTANSFYNMIDAQFKDGNQPPLEWSQAGTIYPSIDLTIGDKAVTRVFDAIGERHELQTVLTITSNEQGLKNNWTHALATKINAEQSQIRAGQQSANGEFNPIYGMNPVYLKRGSNLERVEIDLLQLKPPVVDTVSVSGLASDYVLEDGKVTLDFTVTAQGDLAVTNTLYDHGGVAKGQSSADIKDSSHTFTMALEGLKAGHHQLVIKGMPKAGGEAIQQTMDLMFKEASSGGDYQFVFPNDIKSYTAGTKVLQPKNGKVYQCKPFPYNGYCVQWATTATHYEPGVGSNWQDAWIELN
ncbi:N-acetylglucosamine-binding protein GbpA [Aeromonas sobria]|uniref:N-acetylglucosamine-binding protein A n=1 Tax=Aeromonas sobria TaxID=646 RepID=A0A1S2CK47_AERSO|nr:N-acetylglucosamine-binding protein GbpA [Aeromonas sobria]MBS4687153.1 N-acetylglucosamine-binding protein GbpA [Aeromonas sobria]OHY88448.1 N-acetylglucosamine-binding protein A [Aeromonas sobria]